MKHNTGSQEPSHELLSIGEVTSITGFSSSALHYYERQGLISSLRTPGNQRRYPRQVLRRLSLIQLAKEMEIPLADVGEMFRPFPEDYEFNRHDWIQISERWRRKLETRRHQIEQHEYRISRCLGCSCSSLTDCHTLNQRVQATQHHHYQTGGCAPQT